MQNYKEMLYHHGIKGMKWGVRKKKYVSNNSFDIRRYGRRGANRIEKRMAEKNLTRNQARNREYLRQVATGTALCALYFGVSYPTVVRAYNERIVAKAGTMAGTVYGAAKSATGGYSGKNAAKYVISKILNKTRGVTYSTHKASKFLN